MIKIHQKGDFRKLNNYFERLLSLFDMSILDKYGVKGVEALSAATPVDTGKTSRSWDYTVNRSRNKISIIWSNSNVNEGCNIAIILQYGHGTQNGGIVKGLDYINPSLRPVFESMTEEIWKEATR